MSILSASRLLATTLLLATLACDHGPSSADKVAIRQAQEDFAGVFDIKARRNVYIEARYLLDDCPEEEAALPLFAALLLREDSSPRADSQFVYLNLRDENGRFCYQMYQDPDTGRLVYSDQAYY